MSGVKPGPFYRADSHLDYLRGVPNQVYWDTLQTQLDLRRYEMSAARAYCHGAEQADIEYLRRLHSLIGSKNLPKFLEFREQAAREMRAVSRKRSRPDQGGKDIAKAGRAQAAKLQAFLRTLRVDANQITQLQTEFLSRTRLLSESCFGRDEVAASRLAKRKNETFYPPYDGWSWVLSVFMWISDVVSNQFQIMEIPTNNTPIASPATGKVGFARTVQTNFPAGAHDQCKIFSRAAIVKWYQMPDYGGTVSVRIKAKLGPACHHYGTIGGQLPAGVLQRMRFYARVFSQGFWNQAITWKVFDRQDFNTSYHEWHDDAFVGGLGPDKTVEFGPSSVPGTFSGGTWVLVEAGVFYDNDFNTFGSGVYSNVAAQATILELGLSSYQFGGL